MISFVLSGTVDNKSCENANDATQNNLAFDTNSILFAETHLCNQ
jgi:hypothetical protein